MEREDSVQYKSLEFAKRIVKLYKYLSEKKRNLFFRSRYCDLGQALAQTLRKPNVE